MAVKLVLPERSALGKVLTILTVFYCDTTALAFASVKNNGISRRTICRRRATAMRIALERKSTRAKTPPHQARSRGGHNPQRHRLLPVHSRTTYPTPAPAQSRVLDDYEGPPN